jgi:hypothetical protein
MVIKPAQHAANNRTLFSQVGPVWIARAGEMPAGETDSGQSSGSSVTKTVTSSERPRGGAPTVFSPHRVSEGRLAQSATPIGG